MGKCCIPEFVPPLADPSWDVVGGSGLFLTFVPPPADPSWDVVGGGGGGGWGAGSVLFVVVPPPGDPSWDVHYKNVRVISTLPGLARLHLFSDLQYYILLHHLQQKPIYTENT